MLCSAFKGLRYFQESGFVKSIFCLEHLCPVALNWAAAGADCGEGRGTRCALSSPPPRFSFHSHSPATSFPYVSEGLGAQ